MKLNNIFIPLILPFTLSTCTENTDVKFSTNQLMIIVDVTDSATIFPDSISVLRFFDIHKEKQNGAVISITTITDKMLNPRFENSLNNINESKQQQINDDIHYRDKEIQLFYANVLKGLSTIKVKSNLVIPLEHSECFKVFCKELAVLKMSSKEGRKEVWVYGDMLENSNLFLAYKQPLYTAKERKDLVNIFEQTNLLPNNLNGISVRFFYNPPTRAADSLYSNMIMVYQTLLQKKGATIFVNASNNVND